MDRSEGHRKLPSGQVTAPLGPRDLQVRQLPYPFLGLQSWNETWDTGTQLIFVIVIIMMDRMFWFNHYLVDAGLTLLSRLQFPLCAVRNE